MIMETADFRKTLENVSRQLTEATGEKGAFVVIAYEGESKQIAKLTQGDGRTVTGILIEFLTNPDKEVKPVVDMALIATIQDIHSRHRNNDRKKPKR